MEVYDWATSGHLSAAISTLNRALGQFARWHGIVYIGVTGSPASREEEHKRSGWGEMVYLYRTGSRKYAYEMEKRLIDHCRSRGYSANDIGGSGGRRPCQCDVYYIYMLLE
jgi:hypothetical protein